MSENSGNIQNTVQNVETREHSSEGRRNNVFYGFEIYLRARYLSEHFSDAQGFHRFGYIESLRNFALHSSQGLSLERIENFKHFTADESLVDEQCLICMNDLEIGMEMVRLDCHVDHILC